MKTEIKRGAGSLTPVEVKLTISYKGDLVAHVEAAWLIVVGEKLGLGSYSDVKNALKEGFKTLAVSDEFIDGNAVMKMNAEPFKMAYDKTYKEARDAGELEVTIHDVHMHQAQAYLEVEKVED